MSKKNIYLVQVGFAFDKSLYLPLAAGVLAAFALQDNYVRETYDFKDFIFRREKLDDVVSRMEKPVLVGFSCCVWNFEYNKALARKVKQAFPDTLILFGGHNIPDNNDILINEDYVDVLMRGESEEPFLDLLKALPGSDFEKIPNISYRDSKGQIKENPRQNYTDIEGYPSAYTSGIFDSLLQNNPDVDFLAILETNRGCPYSCSYCDWCAGKAVRHFPMEKVKAEIAWMSENKIEYCFCADANFGMFKRDLEIVDFIVEMKAKNGYPKVFRPCYAKNSDENVFQISKKLNSMEMDKGATLAYQTLSDEALTNINRKNLTLDKFANLLAKYNQAGIPSYSELILGLPGETYESFSSGICELLEAGQHNSISVYHCELLINSEMAQEDYKQRHGIVTARIPFNHIHSADIEEEVQEYSNVIIATNTMSNEMWIKSNLFSVCVQCFHNLGLLRCFALYMYYEKGISYMNFFNKLLSYIKQAEGTLANRLFDDFEKELKDTKTGKWMYLNPLFGDASWFFEEGAFLEFVMNYERFWKEIMPFLSDFKLEDKVFNDLVKYQKVIIKRPGTPPQKTALSHDFSTYFDSIYSGQPEALKKKHNILHTAGDSDEVNWIKYAKETVWFGRRRGATLRTNNKGEVRTEYLGA